MAKLISIKQVRDRLTLADDEGINAAIKSAIEGATIMLGTTLSTDLDSGSADELFFIDSVIEDSQGGFYILCLGNGFVKSNPSVAVYAGVTLDDAMASSAVITPTRIDYEKGFIMVPDTLADQYIRVVYTYGFLDTEKGPKWLQECMVCYTAKVLSSQQITDGKPELNPIFKFLEQHVGSILVSRLRISSLSIRQML